jgi:hypothetical protein
MTWRDEMGKNNLVNAFGSCREKARNGVLKVSDKVKAGVLSAALAMEMAPVHATGGGSNFEIPEVTINQDMDATNLISQFLGIVIWIAQMVGIFFIIWGAVMLGLALKNDEPESKQKAIMVIVSGVVLFGLLTILKAAGIIG